jgi:hypothetical protein
LAASTLRPKQTLGFGVPWNRVRVVDRLPLARWIVRRLAEFVASFAASVMLLLLLDGQIALQSAPPLTLAVLLVYAGPLLYLPLSLAIWIAMSFGKRAAWRTCLDSLFFVVHGYVAMCVMYNGFWAISRPIDPSNAYVLVWFGLATTHLLLAVASRPKVLRSATG